MTQFYNVNFNKINIFLWQQNIFVKTKTKEKQNLICKQIIQLFKNNKKWKIINLLF